MRHVLAPDAITPVAFRAGEAAVSAPSISSTGLTLRLVTRLPSAALSAIALPPVAMAANQNLNPTAGTKEKAAAVRLIKITTAPPN